MRLMNSGRNVAAQRAVDGLLHGLLVAVLGELADELRCPRCDVMMMMAFLKLTTRPWPSVRRPSSSTCSRMLNTSGCAFSISSSSITRIGLAAHGLGQLAALVVAHVSRRRADEALHAELLHVLGHVDAHHGLLAVEQVLGQRLRQFGLAHARGAQEQKASRWGGSGSESPARLRRMAPATEDDGLVLADHALVQLLLQVHQLGHLALHHLLHGDARPRATPLRRSRRRTPPP